MYLINAIALIINKNFGIFIIETIMVWVGTIFVFKTSRFLLNNMKSFLICVFYQMLIFLFISGGNFTEEYSLTFSAIGLFYMFKILYNSEADKKCNWIIIGMTFALNIFIKPTYIALWIAFGLAMLIYFIKEKQYTKLVKAIVYSFIGVIVISLPILVYLIANNCFYDFVNAYLILNSKYSASSMQTKIRVAILLNKRTGYYIFLILSLISNIMLICNKKIKYNIKIFVTTFFIVAIILTSCAANMFNHYLIANALAISLEFIYLLYLCKDIDIPNLLFYILIIFILIFTSIKVIENAKSDYNEAEVTSKKETLDLIKTSYLSNSEDVLVLGNEPYFYIYLGKFPSFKYFFQYPIINYDKNIATATESYIKDRKPKVLICALESRLNIKQVYGEDVNNLIIDDYNEYDGAMKYYVLKNEK